jgi:hypothetical protein
MNLSFLATLIVALMPTPAEPGSLSDRNIGVNPPIVSRSMQKTASDAERLKTLRKEVDEARAAHMKALRTYKAGDPKETIDKLWDDYIKKAGANNSDIIEIVSKHPKTNSSFEALEWIVTENNRNGSQPYGNSAIELLRDNYSTNPKVGRICGFLALYSGDWKSDSMVEFLQAVADKNPDRVAKAQALYGLGHIAYGEAENLANTKSGDPEASFKKAEKLLKRVTKEFANCPDLQRGRGLLSDKAGPELYEILHLRIGKEAPEIKGRDLDGKSIKLTDYRGKVVVLDFWGNW